jgi:uncharacterized protein
MNTQRFSVLRGTWTVARLGAKDDVPMWALNAPGFVSITRTDDELSIVCQESVIPSGVQSESGWAILKLQGPFPFAQLGVLASFASPLGAAGVSIFSVSTFDTDYILIKAAQVSAACKALTAEGHELVE